MAIVMIALYTEIHSPRFQALRAVDVVLLFFAGVAFGAAVVTLVNGLRRGDSSNVGVR